MTSRSRSSMKDAERAALYEQERVRARALAEQEERDRRDHISRGAERMGVVGAQMPPLVRTTDVETSHEAAAQPKAKLRMIVLGLHYEHPNGLMDDELGMLAGRPGHESYRRRGAELRALGWTEWLMHDDEPVRRRTAIGGTARVSRITQVGREVWEARLGE